MPVQLVYAEGYYYLVVFNEKHDDFANYRVDRMDRIEVLDEPALKNERIATFDARELESRAFGMYSGEPVAATLLVDEEIMGAVIDGSARTWSRCRRGRSRRVCTPR